MDYIAIITAIGLSGIIMGIIIHKQRTAYDRGYEEGAIDAAESISEYVKEKFNIELEIKLEEGFLDND